MWGYVWGHYKLTSKLLINNNILYKKVVAEEGLEPPTRGL